MPAGLPERPCRGRRCRESAIRVQEDSLPGASERPSRMVAVATAADLTPREPRSSPARFGPPPGDTAGGSHGRPVRQQHMSGVYTRVRACADRVGARVDVQVHAPPPRPNDHLARTARPSDGPPTAAAPGPLFTGREYQRRRLVVCDTRHLLRRHNVTDVKPRGRVNHAPIRLGTDADDRSLDRSHPSIVLSGDPHRQRAVQLDSAFGDAPARLLLELCAALLPVRALFGAPSPQISRLRERRRRCQPSTSSASPSMTPRPSQPGHVASTKTPPSSSSS